MKNADDIKYIKVVLPLPIREEFTYSLKAVHEDIIGRRVAVAFRGRNMVGYVISEAGPVPDKKISKISGFLDDGPVFTRDMIRFLKWISGYYLCSLGEVMKLALPAVLSGQTVKKIFYIKSGNNITHAEEAILNYCEQFGPAGIDELIRTFGNDSSKIVSALIRKGFAKTEYEFLSEKKEILLIAYRLTGRSTDDKKLKNIPDLFPESGIVLRKELRTIGLSQVLAERAVSAGVLEKIRIRKNHIHQLMSENIIPADSLTLNSEQEKCAVPVIAKIRNREHAAFLLYGITGSGKTAVYIRLVAEALSSGSTALILVPEISLTPQTVRQFRSHLGNTVAVLHSRMSDLERYETWDKLRRGIYRVAVGPRSAVFAPLENLGIIIVDEEHDQSYKQSENSPRYCAKNSSVIRAYMNGIPVVLGSATPSAESFYNTFTGKYVLLELKNRFSDAKLPDIKIVKKENIGTLFENFTVRIIKRELDLSRKVIVLQNRRGYSPVLICGSCRESVLCPNCSVTLTYHLSKKQLICHYCGYFEKSRNTCPKCGEENIYFRGAGTEQVEEELKKLFPDIPVYRMDQDTTRKKDGHSSILDKFGKSGAAILTGTKMIAKGLDFHDVSVVCIVNIDSELIFPDFRSDERAFQLIEQVAGRAGRGKIEGEVVLQSFNDHAGVLEYVKDHNYTEFLKNELKLREMTSYPPFSRIIKLTLSSRNLPELRTEAMKLFTAFISKNKNCVIYRPVERMVLKVNNIFRLYILIKSLIINDRNGTMSRKLVTNTLAGHKSSSKIKIDIDVDPVDLM